MFSGTTKIYSGIGHDLLRRPGDDHDLNINSALASRVCQMNPESSGLGGGVAWCGVVWQGGGGRERRGGERCVCVGCGCGCGWRSGRRGGEGYGIPHISSTVDLRFPVSEKIEEATRYPDRNGDNSKIGAEALIMQNKH